VSWDFLVDDASGGVAGVTVSSPGSAPTGLCGAPGVYANCLTVAPSSTTTPFTAIIPGMIPGVSTYVAVRAVIGAVDGGGIVGFGSVVGSWGASAPSSAAPPIQAPDAPVSPYSPASPPLLSCVPPPFEGVATVVQYKVEWDPLPTFFFTSTGTPLGTAAHPWDQRS
jgi:hypothetical protein